MERKGRKLMENISGKNYSFEFALNSKLLAVIYICYKYKFPMSIMLTLYEMFKDQSIFILKILSCTKKIKISDNELIKILDESRKLYLQIQKGISTRIKIKKIKLGQLQEELPEEPTLNLEGFSIEFVNFIENYLLKNIEDIYAPIVKLELSTTDLYEEII